MRDRSLRIFFTGSTVWHEIQHCGSKNNHKVISVPLRLITAIMIFKEKLILHQNASALHCIPTAKNTWKKKQWKLLINSLALPLLWKMIKKTFIQLLSNPCLSLQKPSLNSKVHFQCLLHLPDLNEHCARKGEQFTIAYGSTEVSSYRILASPDFQIALWLCTGNIVTPWRFSPLSSNSQKWKQIPFAHQRMLSLVLIASFCYSWQMAWFLWVEEKPFPSWSQILVLLWHTSQRIQE